MEIAPSRLASFGRYVLSSRIFDILGTLGRGAGDEMQLAVAINRLAQEGDVVARRFDGTRYDCGDKLGYVKAVSHAALQSGEMGCDVGRFLAELGFFQYTPLELKAAP